MSIGRVLIVDDEPDLRELLDHNLRKNDFETRQAPDGLSACRMIGEEHPDLVLLDLMLPDLDGRDVCRMVRGHENPVVATTPILMLTALSASADRLTGLHVGADDYLAKPFSVEEVVLRAKRLVAGRKHGIELEARATHASEAHSHLLELQDLLFHDLRNQLAIVRGFSGRICEHGDLLPTEKIRAYAQAIRRSSTHLSSLADEMLLLRKIDFKTAEMPSQSVDARSLVQEVVNLFAGASDERGISVVVDAREGLPPLAVNRSSAKIMLSCLVDNAVKYGRQGGTVKVTCDTIPGGCIAITVEDNGRGIPEEELDRIFDRFYRGSNILNSADGTGLGLYFAKRLTEPMGGRISAESEVGTGSCFRVELPT